MTRMVLGAIAALLFMYGYVRWLEHRSLYFPMTEIEATPQHLGMEYEDLQLVTSDDRHIHGWFIPAYRADCTILFFHGNGGNISHRLDKIACLHGLALNVCIIDYRGYGRSRGRPSEAGFYRDAAAAHRWILSRQPQIGKLIVYGESLGGAVAVDLASKVAVDGLILEGAFTNVPDMAKVVYPFLPRWILKTHFDSLTKIAQIKAPLLSFHAQDDEIVPWRLGQQLFAAALPPKRFVPLSGGHNECFFVSQQHMQTALQEFLAAVH